MLLTMPAAFGELYLTYRQGSTKRGLSGAAISFSYLPNDRGVSVGQDAEWGSAVGEKRQSTAREVG